jgi:hypothetical protein
MVINCWVIGSCFVCADLLSWARALTLKKEHRITTPNNQVSVLFDFINIPPFVDFNPFAWSDPPLKTLSVGLVGSAAAEPAGTWAHQGPHGIGHAAGGANAKFTGKLGFQASRWNAFWAIFLSFFIECSFSIACFATRLQAYQDPVHWA